MRVPLPFLPFAVSIQVGVERRLRSQWRWRIRLRTLSVLVALAALIMGGVAAQRRKERWQRWQSAAFDRQHEYHIMGRMYARAEAYHRKTAATGETLTLSSGNPEGWVTLRLRGSELLRLAEEEGRLRRKYEGAASHLWDTVEPDPSPSVIEKLADEKGLVRTPQVPSGVKTRPWPFTLGKIELRTPDP
jgi:hypothetical protein